MERRLTLLTFIFMGCAGSPPPEPLETAPDFAPQGNPYEPGPLVTTYRDIAEGEFAAPRPLRIHAPVDSGTYSVVQFQHGFLSDRRAYDAILSHLASHGFVVVAPQMYPADGIPLGKPTAQSEADAARRVVEWAQKHAASVMGSTSADQTPGVAGHSRGGKVTWLLSKSVKLPGIFGVDPVDGRGGPLLSAQPEALPQPLTEGPPSAIVGMEIGGACAPEGDNYQHFFENAAAPTRLYQIKGHGHGDMLDDDVSTEGLCFEGPKRQAVQKTVAGLMTAFFRSMLYNDNTVAPFLEDSKLAPMEVTLNAR